MSGYSLQHVELTNSSLQFDDSINGTIEKMLLLENAILSAGFLNLQSVRHFGKAIQADYLNADDLFVASNGLITIGGGVLNDLNILNGTFGYYQQAIAKKNIQHQHKDSSEQSPNFPLIMTNISIKCPPAAARRTNAVPLIQLFPGHNQLAVTNMTLYQTNGTSCGNAIFLSTSADSRVNFKHFSVVSEFPHFAVHPSVILFNSCDGEVTISDASFFPHTPFRGSLLYTLAKSDHFTLQPSSIQLQAIQVGGSRKGELFGTANPRMCVFECPADLPEACQQPDYLPALLVLVVPALFFFALLFVWMIVQLAIHESDSELPFDLRMLMCCSCRRRQFGFGLGLNDEDAPLLRGGSLNDSPAPVDLPQPCTPIRCSFLSLLLLSSLCCLVSLVSLAVLSWFSIFSIAHVALSFDVIHIFVVLVSFFAILKFHLQPPAIFTFSGLSSSDSSSNMALFSTSPAPQLVSTAPNDFSSKYWSFSSSSPSSGVDNPQFEPVLFTRVAEMSLALQVLTIIFGFLEVTLGEIESFTAWAIMFLMAITTVMLLICLVRALMAHRSLLVSILLFLVVLNMLILFSSQLAIFVAIDSQRWYQYDNCLLGLFAVQLLFDVLLLLSFPSAMDAQVSSAIPLLSSLFLQLFFCLPSLVALSLLHHSSSFDFWGYWQGSLFTLMFSFIFSLLSLYTFYSKTCFTLPQD